jgi:hypothetical protein
MNYRVKIILTVLFFLPMCHNLIDIQIMKKYISAEKVNEKLLMGC